MFGVLGCGQGREVGGMELRSWMVQAKSSNPWSAAHRGTIRNIQGFRVEVSSY